MLLAEISQPYVMAMLVMTGVVIGGMTFYYMRESRIKKSLDEINSKLDTMKEEQSWEITRNGIRKR